MLNKDTMKSRMRATACFKPLLMLLAFLLPMAQTARASAPAAVISTVTTLSPASLPGNQVGVAVDNCGNIYSIQYESGNVYETPAGGGTASKVFTGSAPTGYGSPVSVNFDAAKANLYLTEGGSGNPVYQVPVVNCVLQSAQYSDYWVTGTDKANVGGNQYYWNANAVAADANGHKFVATTANTLIEMTTNGVPSTLLLGGLANNILSVAIDANNNLYLVMGNGLYELAYNGSTYSSTPTLIPPPAGITYTTLIGVTIDQAGDLVLTDQGIQYQNNSTLYMIPNEANGSTYALNPSDEYIIASGMNAQSPAGIDPQGNLYFVNWSSSIVKVTAGSFTPGSAVVGNTASANANVVFSKASTLSAISFSGAFSAGSSGSCAIGTAYKVGQSCTVNIAFTPKTPGDKTGQIVLSGASNAVLGTGKLYATGNGAGLTIDPGTVATLGSGWKTPAAVAVDGSGNVFIADAGNNAVYEIAAGSTTPVSVGTGLSSPKGVAVDGAGNLFIADSGNERIVEVPVVSGVLSTSAQLTIVSGTTTVAGSLLNNPTGLATDAQGNLYIADTGNNRILYIPQIDGLNPNGAIALGSGWSRPLAIHVTLAGVIYVTDSGNGSIYSLPYPSSAATRTIINTGYSNPSALAMDASGALFLADGGNGRVMRIPNVNGILLASSAQNVSSGIATPYGLGIDAAGNLYVSDNSNAAAYAISRTSPSQNAGIWNPGSTSSAVSYQVESTGNQPLIFSTPYYTASGNSSSFQVLSSESNACASAGTVTVGAICNLQATFTPAVAGLYSATLALASNATNTATPQATFTGKGEPTTPTTTTLAVTSPTGNPYYGQAISLSVTVSASTGTPSGTVALLVDGVQTATATLNSSGVATFNLSNGLGGGNHTLQASYQGIDTGTVVYSRSQSTVNTITVTKVATTTAESFTTLYFNPSSQPAGTPLNFSATVTPGSAGLPTGSVLFTITDSTGSTVTQTAVLAASSATITYTPTAPLSGAYHVISLSATYSGDANFAASTSAASTFNVSPATGSLAITTSGSTLTSSVAEDGTLTYTATTYGGWQGLVSFQCEASTLPANAVCVFSPAQVSVMANTATATYPTITTQTQLKIVVDNPPNSPVQSSNLWLIGGLSGLVLFFARRRWMHGVWNTLGLIIAVILLAGAASGLTACTSGVKYGTPAGTSAVKVYAYADPFVVTSGVTNPLLTQACGNNASGVADPSVSPCMMNSFQVTLTVQ
jgi:sugar lactone lactonase YvrE